MNLSALTVTRFLFLNVSEGGTRVNSVVANAEQTISKDFPCAPLALSSFLLRKIERFIALGTASAKPTGVQRMLDGNALIEHASTAVKPTSRPQAAISSIALSPALVPTFNASSAVRIVRSGKVVLA